MKLKTKIISALLIVALLSTAIGMLIAIRFTKHSFNDYLANYASNNIAQWQQAIEVYYKNNQTLEGLQNAYSPQMPRMMGRNRGMQRGFAFNEQVIVINEEGKIVLDSLGNTVGQKADSQLLNDANPVIVDGQTVGRVAIRVNPPVGVLTLEEQFIASVYKGFLWGGLLAIIITLILGYVLANGLVRPIHMLTKTVKEFAQGNWFKRSPIVTNDEIGLLSKTFNQMAEELDKNLKLKKQMVADVSHELRTPITILRGNMESIQAGVIEATPQLILSMNDEILRLSRLVSELQQLSLLDNNSLPINKKRVDLVGLIKKTYEVFLVEAQSKEINIKYITSKEPFYLEIDEDKITQVVVNLLSNAIRHTPLQGKITITIEETGEEKPGAVIKIADEGPGIPAHQLENIFERFYRTDEARNRERGGMGLGLAITKGIVEAHGGRIEIVTNNPKGTIFTVYLPS